MKPQFLMSAGTSYSATTPLYFTLSEVQKYCHAGVQKENGYLKLLNSHLFEKDGSNVWKKDYHKFLLNRGSDRNEWIQKVDDRQFIHASETEELFSSEYTLQNYYDYYVRHYERIKGTYHAVSDFTNYNFELPEDFLIEWRDQMSKYFDIKITFVFRDPIRRYFSEVGKFIQFQVLMPGYMHAFKIKHNAYVRKKKHIKLFELYLSTPDRDPGDRQFDYITHIKKFERVFGSERVFPIVMEDFWNSERQAEVFEKLSEFLGYPITKAHENVYYPDRGSKAHQIEGLSDQYGSDFEDITPQLYEWAKQHLGYIYSEWENHYGSLPVEWNS